MTYTVTQEDVSTARRLIAGIADETLSPDGLADFAVNFVAHHRIETLERAAEVAEAEKWGDRHVAAADRDGNTDPATYNEACNDIAAKIRALKGKSDE